MSNEPVIATVVNEPRDRWLLLAVLSWIVPLLGGIASIFLLVTQWNLARYGLSWGILGMMLVLGFVLSIGPLASRANLNWSASKTNAVIGIVFSIFSVGWLCLCLLVAVVITVQHDPARQRVVADAQRQERLEQQRIQQQTQQQLAEERRARAEVEEAERRADDDRRYQEFLKERERMIRLRDENIVNRFQGGNNGGQLPEIPRHQNPYWRDRPELPDPLIPPHPLTYTGHLVSVKSVDRELTDDAWSIVDDLQVRKLDLAAGPDSRLPLGQRYKFVPRSKMLPGTDESGDVVYLTYSNKLLEIDTRKWRLLREVDLGRAAIDLARCREGIVVGVAEPGRILVLDPDSLQTKMAIDVPDLQQVVASETSSRLYVRVNVVGYYSLGVINLETDQIENIMRLVDATSFGGKQGHMHAYDALGEIGITSDGKFLWAIGDEFCRWSIDEDGTLTCLDVGRQHIRSHRSRGVSPNGRFVASQEGVHDVSKSATSLGKLPAVSGFVDPIELTSDDGRMIAYCQSQFSLIEANQRGTILYRHDWKRMGDKGKMQSIHVLPQPDQWLIQTMDAWYVLAKGERSELAAVDSANSGPVLRVVEDAWPEGNAAKQAVGPQPEVDGIASHKLRGATKACFSSDGDAVFALAGRNLSRIDVKSHTVTKLVQVPEDVDVKHLLCNAAGVVVIGGKPARIWVLDPATLKVDQCIYAPPLAEIENATAAEITTSPAVPFIVAKTAEHHAAMIDVATGAVVAEMHLAVLRGETPPTSSRVYQPGTVRLRMTPDGKRLLSSFGSTLYCCDITPQGFTNIRQSPRLNQSAQLWVSGDSQRAAIGTETDGVLVFAVDELEKPIARFPVAPLLDATALDHNGTSLWRAGLQRYAPGERQGVLFQVAEGAHRWLEYSPTQQQLLGVGAKDAWLVDVSKLQLPPADADENAPRRVEVSAEEDFEITDHEKDIVRERQDIGDARVAVLNHERELSSPIFAHFSPDGKWLFLMGNENTVHQIDLKTLRLRRTLSLKIELKIRLLTGAAGGLGIDCVASGARRMWIVDYETLQPTFVIDLPATNADDQFVVAEDLPLAVRQHDEVISILDLQTLQPLAVCDTVLSRYSGVGIYGKIDRLHVSGDARQVAVYGRGGRQHFTWEDDTLRGVSQKAFPGVNTLYWHPDTKRLFGISRGLLEKRDGDDVHHFLRVYNSDSPEEDPALLPLPKVFFDVNAQIEFSHDRMWLHHHYQYPRRDQRIGMVSLDGDATHIASFPRTSKWLHPAPRGPRALAQSTDGDLYWIELDEVE